MFGFSVDLVVGRSEGCCHYTAGLHPEPNSPNINLTHFLRLGRVRRDTGPRLLQDFINLDDVVGIPTMKCGETGDRTCTDWQFDSTARFVCWQKL